MASRRNFNAHLDGERRSGNLPQVPRKAALERARTRAARKAKSRAAQKAKIETEEDRSPAKPAAQTPARKRETPIKKDPQPCN